MACRSYGRRMLGRRGFMMWGAAALAGCGVREPLRSTFVDAAGRSVELPTQISRVVPAGPPASVLLYALAPEKMLGWPRAPTDEQKTLLAAPYRDLPELGRLTGRSATANIEEILTLAPDLILDVGAVSPAHASLADRVQEQIGVPYAMLDGAFANTDATLHTLGGILGAEAQAERLAEYADHTFAMLAARGAVDGPRVYYGRGADGLETGLAGSINLELLNLVGARNVAAEAGRGELAQISPEQLLAWDPDIILAQFESFRASLLSEPRWSALKAVRGRAVFVPPDAPFGWFESPPSVNRLIGVRWLIHKLYGGDAVALREEVRRFFELFYHVDISAAQVDAVLADV